MKAVIFLNGEPPPVNLIQRQWKQADQRICADGAADACVELGLAPDVVLGDFDSISNSARSFLTKSKFLTLWDQDKTDGEKAIEYAIHQGATDIDIFGAVGRRLDHEIYNLSLLKKFHQQGAEIIIYTEADIISLISQTTSYNGFPGARLSLMPVFGPVDGVSTEGLAYPLNNARLELGGLCSISNEFLGTQAEVRIGSGELLVIQAHNRSDQNPI